jgi:hypothetical protein
MNVALTGRRAGNMLVIVHLRPFQAHMSRLQLKNFSELSEVAAAPAFQDESIGLQAPTSLRITHVRHGTFLLIFLDLTEFPRLRDTSRPLLHIQPLRALSY